MNDIIEWELRHAEISFGGSYSVEENENITAVGYMYNQALNFDPGDPEQVNLFKSSFRSTCCHNCRTLIYLTAFECMYSHPHLVLTQALRKMTLRTNDDYESFFIHFSVDTTFDVKNPTHSSMTSFAGIPWVVGWTASAGHAGFWLYQSQPWLSGVDVFSGYAGGGAFYVYQFEKFDQLDVLLAASGGVGTLLVEYPSEVAPSTEALPGVEVGHLPSQELRQGLTKLRPCISST